MSGVTYRYLLHARGAFPYADQVARESTEAWAQTPAVQSALAVLTNEEQKRVLRYRFPRDAALCLASALLKHYIIIRTCGVRWEQSKIQQDRNVQNGKPYYAGGGVEFNVSHHGEAAILIATTKPGVKVGIDLTHVDMVKDIPKVRGEGFEGWVKVFDSVFSAQETQHMIQAGPKASADTPALVKGLRLFYSYWALKEAYFKMTGDALLSSWLQQLEFSSVKPPIAAVSSNLWGTGEETKAVASLRGQTINDTQLELTAIGKDYIAATSITSTEKLPMFEVLDAEQDILPLAR